VRWQPKCRCRTVSLQQCPSCASRVASTGVTFIAAQSSLMLSNHFFLGLPLVRDPSVRPNSAIYGNLLADIRDTCPKYDNHLVRRSSVISLSISKAFMTSTFFLLYRLVTPRIFLKTDISNTFNFCLCSFSVHVFDLYNRSD